jgi:hypothetical protein
MADVDKQEDIENLFNTFLRIAALVAVVFSINKDFKKRKRFPKIVVNFYTNVK